MIPRATYRLQLHAGFTFADAAAQADYFAALGISHIYASPILMARKGSRHGYDVVDHSRVNPELGGEEGFRAMALALRKRHLGIIVDMVPNHMAVGHGDNPWWLDLLAKGQDSSCAQAFDIDWSTPGLEGKVLAPFLDGEPGVLLEKGDLALARDTHGWGFRYLDHWFPLREQDCTRLSTTDPLVLSLSDVKALLATQYFVLANWREADARINWRRFFDITELAAIQVGHPPVFEKVHAKIFALYREGLIDGVRIDHVDGLADPRSYCRLLRERLRGLGREPYLVVEKILAQDEQLPADWSCDGTTGYDFMEEISVLQHSSAGDAVLDGLWQSNGHRGVDFEIEEIGARREILTVKFAAQLSATARAFMPLLPRVACEPLEAAITEIIVYLRCYRDYTTGAADSPAPGRFFSNAVARATASAPALTKVIASIASLFSDHSGGPELCDAIRRFHQLSAPVAAKAVEDTAFYRYGRLLSRNDVGFDPRIHAISLPRFHERMCARTTLLPSAMLTTATHDHKRGEDARARLAVLSERPAEWAEFLAATPCAPDVNPADCYILYQTLVGAWPDSGSDEAFAERITGWCEKHLREAKLRSSWTVPDRAYERRFQSFARALLLSPEMEAFRARLHKLLEAIAPMAWVNTLVQAALRCTLPGVPDLYQGCEFEDYSLVDPDNRRPVDFASRVSALKRGSNQKQAMISKILLARSRDPALWSDGDYRRLETGDSSLGFSRSHAGSRLLVFARRHSTQQCREVAVTLDRTYTSVLEGTEVSPGPIDIDRLTSAFPVAVLHSASSSNGQIAD